MLIALSVASQSSLDAVLVFLVRSLHVSEETGKDATSYTLPGVATWTDAISITFQKLNKVLPT